MKRHALLTLLLAAPLLAQNPPTLKTRLEREQARVSPKVGGVKPALLGAENWWVLPHLVDGGGWTFQVVVTNLSNNPGETYEVDFYGDNGAPFNFNINGQGSVSKLTGTLGPYQSVILASSGTTSTSTVDGWGYLSDNSGLDISAFQILRNYIPSNGLASEASAAASVGISQSGATVAFDNTGNYSCGFAFANADVGNIYSDGDTLDATVYDNQGHQIGTHQITLTALHKSLLVLPQQWPETAGIQGSIFFYPDSVTANLSPITPLAFRLLILPQSSGFSSLIVSQYSY